MRRIALAAALTSMAAFAAFPAAAEISVRDAWVRATVTGVNVTAGYARIANPGPAADELLSISTPNAGTVELHKTTKGTMSMEPVGALTIPAKGSVELKPGTYHLMIMNLKEPLKVGETMPLTFTFKKQGELKVIAKVAPLSAQQAPN